MGAANRAEWRRHTTVADELEYQIGSDYQIHSDLIGSVADARTAFGFAYSHCVEGGAFRRLSAADRRIINADSDFRDRVIGIVAARGIASLVGVN